MARNSRFRTTSGSSSGRSFSDKGKKKSFKKESGSRKRYPGDANNSKPQREGRDSSFKSYPSKVNRDQKKERGEDKRKTYGEGLKEDHAEQRNPRSFSKSSKFGSKGTYSSPGKGNVEKPSSPAGKGKSFQKPKWDQDKRVSPWTPPGGEKSRPHAQGGESPAFRKSDPRSPDFPGKRKNSDPRERKSFVESRPDDERISRPAGPSPSTSDLVRLNKYISNSGVCSRREADDLIIAGLITVNGKSITELGYKVKLTDDVRYEGKRLKAEKPVYLLLNKPKGFITTTDDPQERNTVMQLISGACRERVYPVGRLDRNTSGLLLLTNDGDLTEKLTHPSHEVKKIYKAELDKPLTKNDFKKIQDGVRLEEGKAIVDDLAIVSDDGKTIGIELHIGWNRIVRRIFESLGYEVVKLDRSVYATLDKKELPRGHWRFLRQDEIIRLKHFQ